MVDRQQPVFYQLVNPDGEMDIGDTCRHVLVWSFTNVAKLRRYITETDQDIPETLDACQLRVYRSREDIVNQKDPIPPYQCIDFITTSVMYPLWVVVPASPTQPESSQVPIVYVDRDLLTKEEVEVLEKILLKMGSGVSK